MRYYFISNSSGKRNIIVAQSIENARKIAEDSNIVVDDIYELKADTFKDEGFLF